VQSWLIEHGAVDPARVFLRSAKIVSSQSGDQKPANQGGKALFSLR
jgi:hypothetical protein